MQTILLVLQIILAIFLIGLVLIQRSDDSSMGGLGGGMGGNGFMSRRSAGNFLTKMTAIVAFLFAITSLGLTIVAKKQTQTVSLLDHLNTTQPAPIAVPAESFPSVQPQTTKEENQPTAQAETAVSPEASDASSSATDTSTAQ